MFRYLGSMVKKDSIILLALLWGVIAQAGWWTDGSCDSVPGFLYAVVGAMDFAQTAVILYGEGNEYVVHAAGLLFEEGTADIAIARLSGVAAMQGTYRGTVRGTWAQAGVAAQDVIFSCSFSMMNDNPTTYSDGQVYFWERSGQYTEPADSIYYQCRNPYPMPIMAYTQSWEDPTSPQVIRLCPVFLSYVAAQRWSSYSHLDPAWLINIPPQAAALLKTQYATPVDLYGLLELTILHELTHTAQGGKAEEIPPTFPELGTNGFRSATNVPDAQDNAETVALMGLLSKLAQLGFEVDEEGDLYRIATSKNKERSLVNMSRFHLDK